MKLKKTLIFIILILSITTISIVHATTIRVDIKEAFQTSNINHYDTYNEDKNLYYANTYLRNIGSVSCNNYVRLEIYNNESELNESIWGNPTLYYPGHQNFIDAYWFPFNQQGDFEICKKIYSCYDLINETCTNITIKNTINYTKNNNLIDFNYKQINENTIKINLKTNKTELFIYNSKTPYNIRLNFPKTIYTIPNQKNTFYLNFDTPTITDYNNKIELTFFDFETNTYQTTKIKLEKYTKKTYQQELILTIITLITIIIILIINIIKNKEQKDKIKTNKKTKINN
jgi:hypothetical protein